MQGDIFKGFENMKWSVISIREEEIWNEQNKRFDKLVTYAHTKPNDWIDPPESDLLPWEE